MDARNPANRNQYRYEQMVEQAFIDRVAEQIVAAALEILLARQAGLDAVRLNNTFSSGSCALRAMNDSTHQPGANLESLFLDEEIVQREPSAESHGHPLPDGPRRSRSTDGQPHQGTNPLAGAGVSCSDRTDSGSRNEASLLVDATRCVTVLVLSDKANISKAEAERYLRIVAWKQRGRRHIPAGAAGSFREVDLVVRRAKTDRNGEVVAFGGDGDTDAVVVTLPAFVRDQYAKAGMSHLHACALQSPVNGARTPPVIAQPLPKNL